MNKPGIAAVVVALVFLGCGSPRGSPVLSASTR